MDHTFHVPVLGLGYSIDTPLKIARYGISSVLSIVDDDLIERMRKYHSNKLDEPYTEIEKKSTDSRARRITAYLDLLQAGITKQLIELKKQEFLIGNDICRYFELLPEKSVLAIDYKKMLASTNLRKKQNLQSILKANIVQGSIDVNIMAKVDKMNYLGKVYLGDENTDALAALRGFANSKLQSSVIMSAGMNPRLYSYMENFTCFMPDSFGIMQKKFILKVSDFRSALIQAKFLAKKAIWVSEFRIESGLNCGGHAFATDGFLLGPILEEFKLRRKEMYTELLSIYKNAIEVKNLCANDFPIQRVTAQGGIGTAAENKFLLEYYELDATGWGSPFLLVPEVTNVDQETLTQLAGARNDDYYLSDASPLGVLFNNFKPATAETQRLKRIAEGRPGSPCTKKFLCSNTEFTVAPICTASRKYQQLKIAQLDTLGLVKDAYEKAYDVITEKICLCEGLCSSTYLKLKIALKKETNAVAICPGPNLAYFSRVYSLDEMVGHIYGKTDLLAEIKRPHIFIKELELYIAYLQKDVQLQLAHLTEKKIRYFEKFKAQLLSGITYYKQLITGQSLKEHSEIAGSTPGSTWPDGFQLSLDMLIGYELQVQSILIIQGVELTDQEQGSSCSI